MTRLARSKSSADFLFLVSHNLYQEISYVIQRSFNHTIHRGKAALWKYTNIQRLKSVKQCDRLDRFS